MRRFALVLLLPTAVACSTGAYRVRLPDASQPILGAHVTHYEDPDQIRALRQHVPDNSALVAAAATHLTELGRADLHYDPSLDAAAVVVALMFDDRKSVPSAELIQWLLWKTGVAAVYRSVGCAWLGGTEEERDRVMLQLMREAFARTKAEDRRHYGVVRVQVSESREVFALLQVSRPLLLEPTPMRVEDRLLLVGKVDPRLDAPELMLDIDGFAFETVRIGGGPDGAFRVALPPPITPGIHLLTLKYLSRVEGEAGAYEGSAMTLPFYVGPEPPGLPDFAAIEEVELDVETWSNKVIGGINALRAQAGLPPATVDGELSAIATEHALRVVEDPSGGLEDERLDQRLRAEGWRFATVLQSRWTFQSADALVFHLTHDPFWRARVVGGPGARYGLGYARHEGTREFVLVHYVMLPLPDGGLGLRRRTVRAEPSAGPR